MNLINVLINIYFYNIKENCVNWLKINNIILEKWVIREVGETSVDLQKHSIKDTGGKSRKKDSPEGMYEEVDDRGRGERGM